MIKRRRKKPSAEAEMKAFLASKAVDQISDYSQRGRSYRALSDEQLIESWQAVWNELAADPTNMKTRDVQADLGSEFALRQQEPPWKLVRRQMSIWRARNALGKNCGSRIPTLTLRQAKQSTMSWKNL
jgi:hypothetical protein